MASHDQLEQQVVDAIFRHSMDEDSSASLEEDELIEILRPIVGRAGAKAFLRELLSNGFLRQTRADPIEFEITMDLIRSANSSADTHSTSPIAPAKKTATYSGFKERLLVALAQKDAQTPGYHDLKAICDETPIPYQHGWVRKAAKDFDNTGYIQASYVLGGGEDGGIDAKLTGPGLEEAENIALALNDTVHSNPQASRIPASDRVVRRSDNEDAWANAVESAQTLQTALGEANDLGELSEDEFAQKVHEISALQIMLSSPQIQWTVLDLFAEKTVRYLAVKFADNAIGYAATALLGYLVSLV